jgi:hypothetical protein
MRRFPEFLHERKGSARVTTLCPRAQRGVLAEEV